MRRVTWALVIAAVAATSICSAQQLTRHDLGRTVKFKVLVDKVMQPEADWHTEKWMVDEAAAAGFNVWSPRRAGDLAEVRQVTQWCEEAGILHIPWMRGTLSASLDDETADGKRMVWNSGVEDSLWSPNSDEFWQWTNDLVLEYARISAEMPTLFGVFLDYENYALGPNCYDLSYDDLIMGAFAREKGITIPTLEFGARKDWLTEQGLHDEFEAFQVARWRERCRTLREAVDAIDPTFMFMIYPAPGTKFMVEACYPEWATEQAPLVLADASTYGRASVLPHKQALEANRDMLLERQEFALSQGDNLLYTGGIDPAVKGADPEFSGRNAGMIMEITDGYWIFYEGPTYEGEHPEYFKWFSLAHEAADKGDWAWAWEPRETPDTYGLTELTVEDPTKKQLVVYGWKRPFMDMLQANEEYEVHDMEGSVLSYFEGADVVILQNFNQSLSGDSPFVRMLREYVEQGGGLMLVHDTAWFMASPYPEIARRGYPQNNVEAERHVIWTDLLVEDVRHPALRRVERGVPFETEFYDHMIFRPGDEGTVLVRNEFGDPVYVAGERGRGRVIYAGTYYGYNDALSGIEADLFWANVDWLAGEGMSYRRQARTRDAEGHPAVKWSDRAGF
ncbi:MAG: hypothetical protein GX131_02085 [candidate division WS1 bacterium]|nr:hypothetical protein [candidate division WS1 bacterium]